MTCPKCKREKMSALGLHKTVGENKFAYRCPCGRECVVTVVWNVSRQDVDIIEVGADALAGTEG
jgi:transcription elongation factor Elf1